MYFAPSQNIGFDYQSNIVKIQKFRFDYEGLQIVFKCLI